MLKKEILLLTIKDTQKLAKDIAKKINGGTVIGLIGPLGSGKTTFTQALAKSLGVKTKVKSPTFTLLQLYNLNKEMALCHIDLYRIKNCLKEINTLGIGDYISDPKTITVIEWADKIKKSLPRKTIWLTFSYANSSRRVVIN